MMFRYLILCGCSLIMASETLAMGGIGIGHKSKSRNANGVQAIHAYICTTLDCAKSDIKVTESCGDNASLNHGVCQCNDNYEGNGIICTKCADGYIKNTTTGKCEPVCPTGTSETGEGGYATTVGTGISALRCYCESSGTTYVSSSGCTGTTKPNACASYKDCNKGQYCQFSPSSCSASGTGTCTTLIAGTKNTNNTTDTSDDGPYLIGPSTDWWSAGDWCAAHGMNLFDATASPFNCTTSSYSCPDWSAFTDLGLSSNYWTNKDYGDSCIAWFVDVRGDFINYGRNFNFYALCE